MWKERKLLTYYEKLRRSLYEISRETLENRLIKISLIDSFYKHQKNGMPYLFLDKSELKPKSKKREKETELFNTFLVIFSEGSVNTELKNYIRFFPENSVIKRNLEYLAEATLYKRFNKNLRYFDNPGFFDFTEELLDIDYALLIQQDPNVKKKNRYSLTHFHVKIDMPIADAAEDLAKELRYIQNNLYENGDNIAGILQKKLFEYYCCHHSVGGRRTAGLIAARLLRKTDFLSTIYVSSSESRAMYKYSEQGVSKFFLIQLFEEQILALADKEKISPIILKSKYLYAAGDFYIGISEACYRHTIYATPPEDGKIRKIKPAYNWIKLSDEFLLPSIDALDAKPISYEWVYSSI